MQAYQFSYDKENDDLFLSKPASRSKGSVELGGIVFDYNSKRELVGIQIMSASTFLADVIEENDEESIKNLLENLNECRVVVKPRGNLLIIKLFLTSKTQEITPVISIPNIKETSPALAYA